MLKPILTKEKLPVWEQLTSSSKNIVITAHSGPDGDAIGSALALYHLFYNQGKQVTVIMPNAFPDFLAWLPGASSIINAEQNTKQAHFAFDTADLVFCLDYSNIGRIDNMGQILNNCKAPRIVIDHHLNPEIECDLLISQPTASATCEIIFNLIWQLGYFNDVTSNIADAIYTGLMTDTGSFTYNSNRPEVFFIISQLLQKGINKDLIYRKVYHNYSESRMRLMGYILNEKMEYLPEYHASIYSLTKEEARRYNFIKGDAEGIVNLPLEIKGTRLSISLREDSDSNSIRVSLRSVDNFPCNLMAAQFFNGGGHKNASGGSLNCSIEEAISIAHNAIIAFSSLLKD